MSVQVLVALVSGVVFLLLLLAIAIYLLVRKGTRPVPPGAMYIFRVVLALAGAAFAAILPGFLNIETKLVALAVQAGGALAVFVLIYRMNPPDLLQARLAAPKKAGKCQREAIASLAETLSREEDSRVRYEAVRALRQLAEHSPEAIPPLVGALNDPSLLVQLAAVMALGEIGAPARAAVPQLRDGLKHADWTWRRQAATALGKIGTHDALPALTEALEDEHEKVREAAAEALETIKEK